MPLKGVPIQYPLVVTLGLQIAQSLYYLQTLDPKVGTIRIPGALGLGSQIRGSTF